MKEIVNSMKNFISAFLKLGRGGCRSFLWWRDGGKKASVKARGTEYIHTWVEGSRFPWSMTREHRCCR